MQWWNNLTNFQQVTFIIAITASLIMLIFLILMLIGIGDSDFDGTPDDLSIVDSLNDEPLSGIGGLKLFTLRGLLVFLSIGGWTAFLFAPQTGSIWAAIIGFILGAIATALTALAFKYMLRLESSGNIDYRNAIGKTAVVYIKIPKSNSGTGKVTLTLQDRFVEVDAMTSQDTDILVNKHVEIVGLANETTLIVTEKNYN